MLKDYEVLSSDKKKTNYFVLYWQTMKSIHIYLQSNLIITDVLNCVLLSLLCI